MFSRIFKVVLEVHYADEDEFDTLSVLIPCQRVLSLAEFAILVDADLDEVVSQILNIEADGFERADILSIEDVSHEHSIALLDIGDEDDDEKDADDEDADELVVSEDDDSEDDQMSEDDTADVGASVEDPTPTTPKVVIGGVSN